MSAPRLSIVVPFYGVEAYIGQCLESLAAQTFTDFEAILVDDGSPDDSAAVAAEFCSGDDRFRIVTQDNGGLGPARNFGASFAQGHYLTFVDSDDLVPRPAYEAMVGTLERTGSSIVVGNARRFNNTAGVRQSWTHGLVAASDVTATHVSEFPALAVDRMAWNKVFRREFFSEFGYQFPPIRYEDYPVTLPAHIDARTVDVLRMPCYYWRERESGDSITQQTFNLDNLLDRVASAEMVLEHLGRLPRRAAALVHDNLARIDLQAIGQAFDSPPESELESLLVLAKRFAGHLDPDVMAQRPRFDQIQYAALLDGDAALLGELARFRVAGGLTGGVRATRRFGALGPFEARYPGYRRRRTATGLDRDLFRLTDADLTLRTRVRQVRWAGHDLCVEATAEIQHLPTAADDTAAVWLLTSDGHRYALAPRRFVTTDLHGDLGFVGLRFEVSENALLGFGEDAWPLTFEVEVTASGVTRGGELAVCMGGSPTWPDGCWSPSQRYWWQPRRGPGDRLELTRLTRPVQLASVEVTDDVFELSGYIDQRVSGAAELQVRRGPGIVATSPAALSPYGARTRFTARLSAAALAEDPADDPFLLHSHRPVVLSLDGRPGRSILVPHNTANDTANDTAARARIGPDGRTAVLQPSPARWLTVVHRPAWASVVDVHDGAVGTDGPPGPRLVVADPGDSGFVWRRFDPVTDEPIDVPITGPAAAAGTAGPDTTVGPADRLRELPIDPGRLFAAGVTVRVPGRPRVDWTLFEISADHTGAVELEPRAASRLPMNLVAATATSEPVRVAAYRGSVHVEIG